MIAEHLTGRVTGRENIPSKDIHGLESVSHIFKEMLEINSFAIE